MPRTQGAPICRHIGATEDDGMRRVRSRAKPWQRAGVEHSRAGSAVWDALRVQSRFVSAASRIAVFFLVLLGLWALWEGYRRLWEETGWTRPFRVNDTTMPRLHDIVGALFEPLRTG